MGDSKRILDILSEEGAVQHGHFVLTSGKHSDTYIQCARVLEKPSLTLELAQEAVSKLPEDTEIDLVASPAVGGMLFGFAVAAALDVPFIFSERVEGKMHFRRSFTVPEGARVLIAEDVVTTGGSVAEVVELVEAAGGTVTAVISLIDRMTDRKFTAPFHPLLELPTESWDPDDCTLCKQGISVKSLGSRSLHNPTASA